MNIGILTLQYPNNYGAALQAYSLRRYLLHIAPGENNNVDIINFLPEDYYKNYSLFNLAHLSYWNHYLYRLRNKGNYKEQSRLFDEFRQKYLHLTKPLVSGKQYAGCVNDFDLVIYGSDQIWNNIINGNNEIYYGEYVAPEKRVSFAPSFGFDDITDFQKEMIGKYLVHNKGLSCRETGGAAFIERENPNTKVDIVCDPVFLTSPDGWRKVSQRADAVTEEEKYIFYYSLSSNEELVSKTHELQEKTGLNVLCVHPLCKFNYDGGVKIRNAGPQEFVNLIEHAEFIATDSFHALCFSVLFGKKTLCVPAAGKGKRLTDLIGIISSEKNIGCTEYDMSLYDMDGALDAYRDEINRSRIYLKKNLTV